jgi:hypothetical protein
MVNFLDTQSDAKRFAALLADYEKRLQALERTSKAAYTSIEGGTLDIYTEDGQLAGSVGVQPDGGIALVPETAAATPPPTPGAPTVVSALSGLVVTWDGWWDDSDAPPTDFAAMQVHVGPAADFTPDLTTLAAAITDVSGGSVTIALDGYDERWVRLLALTTAGLLSAPSVAAAGTPRQAVGQDLVDGIVTEVKLAESAVTEAKIALEAVTSDKVKAGAINDLLLADDAVTAAKIAAGAVNATALADGAVLEDKLAKSAVTLSKIAAGAVTINALGGALSDTATQRYVDAMGDPAAWTTLGQGGGASWTHLSGVTDAPTGQTVAQAAGFVQERGTTLIPYEPGVLYRVSARVRLTAPASGSETFYVGVLGVGADKATLVNRSGANSANSHYYVAASGQTITTSGGWVTVVGYLKDRAATGATGSAGPNTDPRSAGLVHADVRFISPYLWLNYNGVGGGASSSVMQVDAFTIEALKTGLVDSTNLVVGSVTTAALATDAVTAGKIAADAISARELQANSVTALELQANSVTAQAIAAGAITADKLTIVGGANLLSDPSFEGPYSAALVSGATYFSIASTGNGSAKSLKVDATATAPTTRSLQITTIPILSGDQLYIGFDYLTSSDYTATAAVKVYARWEDSAGTTLGWGVAQASPPTVGGTTWTRVAGAVTAPASTVQATIWIESYQAAAGSVWLDNAAVRPVIGGVQIADGAITTPKMVAGSIQGDRIAAGSLAADRIVSGSITTSQLSVTTAASVVQKLYDAGADAARWRTAGTSTTTATTPTNLTSVQVADAQSGGYVMRAVGAVSACWRPDILIPFDPAVLYRVSVTVRQTAAGSDTAQQRFYFGVAGVAADGTTLVNTSGSALAGSQHYVAVAAQNLTAGGGWQRYTGYLKGYAASGATGTTSAAPSPTSPGVLHANARYISPVFYANYNAGTGTTEIGMVTVEVVETGAVQTVNISDGAITTPKLIAGAVTTDKLTALAVTAEKIAALAVTTDKLAALSVTADQLAANAVTATTIAAGSIEATHIKVGAITADKLDANAINGKTITGATVQTAASGPRIVMNASSFIGYGTGGNKIGIEPNNAYPYIYWTSDDGTNKAVINVSGGASDANLGLNSGTFVDSADSATYKWRTYLGSDFWVAERVNTATLSANGGRLYLGKATAQLGAGPGGTVTLSGEAGIRAAGVFRADNISMGVVTITPTANTPTSVTLSGGSIKGTNFRAFVTAQTSVPGTQVLGVSVSGVSSAGMTIWLTRTNTNSTSIHWMIIGED